MTKKYAIYGTGGAARDLLGPLRQQVNNNRQDAEICFVDDDLSTHATKIYNHNVTDYADAKKNNFAFCIAISDARIRQSLARKIEKDGGSFFSIFAPTSLRYYDVHLGPGYAISDNVLITSDVVIGAHVHINYYSYVAHDCVIGDFVTFAPRVNCNGNVKIGDGAYIGAGAVLKQGISIGAGATVGMGAVVTKDVPAGATVIGNPARVLNST